jgi:manganese-dependent inorganic pyrophosphatase
MLKLRMIIVTSYDSPDIDGIACSIAYTELLSKLNKETKATYYGELGLEVEFVRKYTNYFPIEKHRGSYDSNTEFILVDTADPDAIELTIPSEKVIEIFDHRQLVFTEKFVNAKKTIELVGSCATLITEEFQKNNIVPFKNSAIYLYSAIISNTINFKNSVTTERDRNAVNWLKSFISLPDDYVKNMFSSKSNINSNNLYKTLSQDFSVKSFGDKKVGIAQIEINDLETKLAEWENKLTDVLNQLKKENDLDYIFFTGIDIFEGFNILFTIDDESKALFSKSLKIPDLKSGYKTTKIIMRKQIWPKIEMILQPKEVS